MVDAASTMLADRAWWRRRALGAPRAPFSGARRDDSRRLHHLNEVEPSSEPEDGSVSSRARGWSFETARK